MSNVILCTDSESATHPELIGLAGEQLDAQPWLDVLCAADEARKRVSEQRGEVEVWVAGSDGIDAINLAAALKRDCSQTVVRLLAFQATGSLFSRAQAAGIDEVLDRPAFLERYQTAKSQSDEVQPRLLRCKPAVHQGARVQPQGFVLAVVGAGGGCGKSSLASLLACHAQARGLSTVLVDADLQFGDLRYLLDDDDALRLDQVVVAPVRLETLKPHGNAPALLAAPERLEKAEVVSSQMGRIVEQLAQRFDCVVLCLGPAWDEAQLQLVESANTVLFLIDQRPSSIRACRHALELCVHCGIATTSFKYALNRCSRQALFSAADVSSALQGVHVEELADGGREVEELLGAGQMSDLLASRNSFAESTSKLADQVLPEPMSPPAQVQMPSPRARRRFGVRRKKAACL